MSPEVAALAAKLEVGAAQQSAAAVLHDTPALLFAAAKAPLRDPITK
jgi:hypothetical protein